MKHFLTLLDMTAKEAEIILQRAATLKALQQCGTPHHTLAGKTLGMIFDKASTRTRVSFETGMFHLGGHALFLHSDTTQLGRGEPVEDSARVLSRMVDLIMIRTFSHEMVQCFADHSAVPVINALTDLTHPCQLLADMFTWQEHRGEVRGRCAAWIGDGNNMSHSWINGAVTFGYDLHIACPKGYQPDSKIVENARRLGATVAFFNSPLDAAKGADLITTDVWASMGQEEEQTIRVKAFSDFKVNAEIMAAANHDALFLHCLPAHRGEEVSADVIDGVQSVVWDEAENRLHAQKALMEHLLSRIPI